MFRDIRENIEPINQGPDAVKRKIKDQVKSQEIKASQ